MVNKMKWMKIGLLTAVCLLITALAACGSDSGGPPAPQPAQGQPAPEMPPAAPQPSEPAAQNPANAGDDWESEWNRTVELAKQEGQVVISGLPFATREEVMKEFEKANPGIKVLYTGARPSQSTPKILAEQQQGKFLVDMLLEVPPYTPSRDAVADIRDYIVRPELRDDKTWHDGFQAGFDMSANSGIYSFAIQPSPAIYINHDVIPEGEINTYEDLLNPKWKGKIEANDFSIPAYGMMSMSGLYLLQGEEFVKKLVEQQEVQLVPDNRQLGEWFSTGRYPIVIGMDPPILTQFTQAGVIQKAGVLRPDKVTVVSTTNAVVLKNPPNPNATKVFLDWLLSQEGQTKFVSIVNEGISRRVDVPRPANPVIPNWDEIAYEKSVFDEEGLKVNEWILQYGKQYKAQSAGN